MGICNICGNEVEFRNVNGRCTPLHINGTCTGEVSAARPTIRTKFVNDFCKPTKCPTCNADVFFIKHNGGTVWVESLGHPWPKHPCQKSKGYRDITKLYDKFKNDNNLKLGLVVCTKTVPNINNNTYVAIKMNDNSGVCFELTGNYNDSLGSIAYISIGRNYSLSTIENGSIVNCSVSRKVEPREFGLSTDWSINPIKILSEKERKENFMITKEYSDKLNKYISITMLNIIKGIKDVFDDAKKLDSVNFLINEGKSIKQDLIVDKDKLLDSYNSLILKAIKNNEDLIKRLKNLQRTK